MDLLAAQQWDDAAVDDALIADSGAGLVALFGVVLLELLAQLLDVGSFAGFRLGCAGISTTAYLGQPFLRERAGLLGGQFPILAQGRLAALAGVRTVLENEHLPARWGNLAQEAGHQRIPEFDGLCLWLCRIDRGLGELDFCHDDSSERPGSQEASRGQQSGSRAKFQKAPAYDGLA